MVHKKVNAYALCGMYLRSTHTSKTNDSMITCPQCKLLIINQSKTLNHYNRVPFKPSNLNKTIGKL